MSSEQIDNIDSMGKREGLDTMGIAAGTRARRTRLVAIAALATATGTVVISRGSNGAGMMYSGPNSIRLPP